MQGLLLNNFYSMQNNIKTSFGIALCLLFVSFVAGDTSVLNAVIAAQIMVFPVNVGSSLQIDEASKWSRIEITLPIKRKTIINAKYISFIMLILMGTAISLFTPVLFYLRDLDTTSYLNLSSGYTMGLSLSISTISILYPVILRFGVEKSEMMIFVSSGLSVVIRIVVWVLLRMVWDNVNFNGSEVGIASLIVAVVMFVASYLLSIQIHRNKEF
ncbi:ABC-2 transporter permease [Paenibacillus sp. IHBB 3054]|uniref:ABC-2 transporter permease n=1 Tax=Paenibacillus sp. IHBB 3054 TaxID=3425689 RepID=UPI003F6645C8